MIRAVVIILLLGLIAPGCLPDPLSRPEAGKTLAYTVGAPDFDLEVVEEATDSTSGILLTLRLPHTSLIFTRSGSGQLALYEYRVRIVPAEDSADMVDEVFADSLRVRQAVPKEAETVTTRGYRLEPGSYRVDVEMTDLNTGGTALRSQRAEVFSLSDGCAHISRFRILQRIGGRLSPYLPFYIPADADSLEAVARIYNPSAVLGRRLSAALITYRTDTAVASPPHYFSPTTWDLSYRGVAFHRPETVWVRPIRVLGDTTTSIRFPFGRIPRGFYELVVEGSSVPCGDEDEPSPIRRHGYLDVFGPGFPRLTSIPQLIGPLAYFARPDEILEILAATAPEEQRLRFDRFWLRLAGSPEAATNVIRQYYTRVEQANLLFSAYKEGWKTDKGMVYIVFGPPGYIDRTYRAESWDYDNGYRFTFRTTNPLRVDEPTRVWVLDRNIGYEGIWTKTVDLLRSGKAY